MSETVDRLPISQVSFGIAPMLLVGVIYTLAGVVALLTGSEPPFGWLTPMLGVWFLGISARKLYFSPPDDDSVADYWIIFQYAEVENLASMHGLTHSSLLCSFYKTYVQPFTLELPPEYWS